MNKSIMVTAIVATATAMDLNKLCDAATDIIACSQPLMDLKDDKSCDSFGQFTQGLDDVDFSVMTAACGANTGRRLLSDPDAKAIVETVAKMHRRLEEMNNQDPFAPENLGALCKDDSCLIKVFRGIKGWPTCMAVPLKTMAEQMEELMPGAGDMLDGMLVFLDPLIDNMENMFKEVCTKNEKGEYCIEAYTKFHGVTEEHCDAALDMGCCLGTLPRVIDAANNFGTSAGFDQSMTSGGITDFAKAMCGWGTLPPACIVSGDAPRAVATVKFALKQFSLEKYNALTDEQKQKVHAAIKKDIANKLGVSLTQVDLKDITGDASGIYISGEVVPVGDESAAAFEAAFADGNVATPETQQVAEAEASVTATLTAEGVESTIANDMPEIVLDNAAGTLHPSLLAAAALALMVAY